MCTSRNRSRFLHPSSSSFFVFFSFPPTDHASRRGRCNGQSERDKNPSACRVALQAGFNLKSVKIVYHLLGHASNSYENLVFLYRLSFGSVPSSPSDFFVFTAAARCRRRSAASFKAFKFLIFLLLWFLHCAPFFQLLFNPSSFYHSFAFLPFHRSPLFLMYPQSSIRVEAPELRWFSSSPSLPSFFFHLLHSIYKFFFREKNTTSKLKNATDLRIRLILV